MSHQVKWFSACKTASQSVSLDVQDGIDMGFKCLSVCVCWHLRFPLSRGVCFWGWTGKRGWIWGRAGRERGGMVKSGRVTLKSLHGGPGTSYRSMIWGRGEWGRWGKDQNCVQMLIIICRQVKGTLWAGFLSWGSGWLTSAQHDSMNELSLLFLENAQVWQTYFLDTTLLWISCPTFLNFCIFFLDERDDLSCLSQDCSNDHMLWCVGVLHTLKWNATVAFCFCFPRVQTKWKHTFQMPPGMTMRQ